MHSTGYYPGFRFLDCGSWILILGLGLLDFCYWIWVPGIGCLDFGFWAWAPVLWLRVGLFFCDGFALRVALRVPCSCLLPCVCSMFSCGRFSNQRIVHVSDRHCAIDRRSFVRMIVSCISVAASHRSCLYSSLMQPQI